MLSKEYLSHLPKKAKNHFLENISDRVREGIPIERSVETSIEEKDIFLEPMDIEKKSEYCELVDKDIQIKFEFSNSNDESINHEWYEKLVKSSIQHNESKDEGRCSCNKKLDEFKGIMLQNFANIEGKLDFLLVALAEQQVLIARLQRQEEENLTKSRKFPITTTEGLLEINENIATRSGDRESYVETMKAILQPSGGVIKNLKYILSDSIISEYNVDGVLGKKSLKEQSHFYNALLEAIPFSEAGSPEVQLRRAMQLQKKRFHKNKH